MFTDLGDGRYPGAQSKEQDPTRAEQLSRARSRLRAPRQHDRSKGGQLRYRGTE